MKQRFEQFVEDFVDGKAMEETAGTIYHVHTSAHSALNSWVGHIDYFVRLEKYEHGMRELLERFLDLEPLLAASGLLRKAFVTDIRPHSHKGLIEHLAYEKVCPATRARAMRYYAQDFKCFGYSMEDAR